MEQVVYVDLFFVINFSMDFLCFFLEIQLLGSKLSVGRTVCASVFGGIYACTALFLPLSGIWDIALDFAVCALMCIIVFKSASHIFGNTVLYIAISAVLGGFMTAMFLLLNRLELPLGDIEGDGISAYVLALLALVSAIASYLWGKVFRRRTSIKHTTVYIEVDGKSVMLEGLCDSGNLLCEPISGKPCIVADIKALEPCLPEDILKMSRSGGVDSRISVGNSARRLRLIPTATATGDGVLIALRADKIYLGEGSSRREVDALVALSSLGESADGASALVPTAIL